MSNSNSDKDDQYLKSTVDEQNEFLISSLKNKLKQLNNQNFKLTEEEIAFLKMGKLTLEQQRQNFKPILEERIRHLAYRQTSKKLSVKLKPHNRLYLISKSLYDIYSMIKGRLHVLPDFLIFAIGRAGTTSLYEGIMEHPDVYRPTMREIYFFDYKYKHGLGWYRGHFPSILKKWAVMNLKKKKFITGDCSGRLLRYPPGPKRIKQNNPNVKLLAILRNPVDRAYSLYSGQVRNGREKLSFWDATQAEKKRLDGLMEKMEKDENFYSGEFFRKSYLYQSIYYDDLKKWFQLFPKKQILVLNVDDFDSKPQKTFERVFDFLGLSHYNVKLIHYNSQKNPEIEPEIRKKLVEYFKPYNKKLYELLDEKFDWDK